LDISDKDRDNMARERMELEYYVKMILVGEAFKNKCAQTGIKAH